MTNQNSRSLIYVPVIHGQSESFFKGESKNAIREINAVISYYFNQVSLQLISLSEKKPVHKAYADSFVGPEINPGNASTRIFDIYSKEHPVSPLLFLLTEGIRIMPTEHPALDFICNSMPELYTKLDILPPKDALPHFKSLLEIREEWYKDLEEICQGEGTFDLTRLRDKYIARNIDRTLEPGENGVLIIGHGHRVDEIVRETVKDIKIDYIKVFPQDMLDIWQLFTQTKNYKKGG